MTNTLDFTQYNQQTLSRLVEIDREIKYELNKPNIYVLLEDYGNFKKGTTAGETAEDAEFWCKMNDVPCNLVSKGVLKTDNARVTKLRSAQLMRGLELNYGSDWIYG